MFEKRLTLLKRKLRFPAMRTVLSFFLSYSVKQPLKFGRAGTIFSFLREGIFF
jgi:hypothetical protein